jgi:hypothetical protein
MTDWVAKLASSDVMEAKPPVGMERTPMKTARRTVDAAAERRWDENCDRMIDKKPVARRMASLLGWVTPASGGRQEGNLVARRPQTS